MGSFGWNNFKIKKDSGKALARKLDPKIGSFTLENNLKFDENSFKDTANKINPKHALSFQQSLGTFGRGNLKVRGFDTDLGLGTFSGNNFKMGPDITSPEFPTPPPVAPLIAEQPGQVTGNSQLSAARQNSSRYGTGRFRIAYRSLNLPT
jgi:hypothetical protein